MTTKFGYDRKSVHSIGILCTFVAVTILIIGWSIGHLLPFYLPLLYSALVLVILNPSIQAALNNTTDPLLTITSFSVALQILNLFAWFCSSLHQIVIQFYTSKRREC
ncbi:hypothetical protein [Paenibacillus polymyxa]|nr:hypothetical protein [Paenibacillus polymyxa]ADM68430.2 hypothetical protein PPE_00576 [Paenibacillus polymyxa E681]